MLLLSALKGGLIGALGAYVIGSYNCGMDTSCYQKKLLQSGWEFGAFAGSVLALVFYQPSKHNKMSLTPTHFSFISLGLVGYFMVVSEVTMSFRQAQDNLPNLNVIPIDGIPIDGIPTSVKDLFAEVESPGNLGIALAEGTKDEEGKETDLIRGHIDPATLGRRRVLNQGFCSDFGRSAPGDIDAANRGCLQRMKSRLPRLTRLFLQQGLNPGEHIQAYWNSVDLWNQGSPYVSDNFPQMYNKNLKFGKSHDEAIRKARVDSFELKANGLYYICRNFEPFISNLRGLQVNSRKWKEKCADLDQNRRRLSGQTVLRRYGVIN
jgi:hypothetical protein